MQIYPLSKTNLRSTVINLRRHYLVSNTSFIHSAVQKEADKVSEFWLRDWGIEGKLYCTVSLGKKRLLSFGEASRRFRRSIQRTMNKQNIYYAIRGFPSFSQHHYCFCRSSQEFDKTLICQKKIPHKEDNESLDWLIVMRGLSVGRYQLRWPPPLLDHPHFWN